MKKIITIIILVLIFNLTGCEERRGITISTICDKPSILSCEQVSECMDECDEKRMITWAMDCRSKFSPYVIAKCG